MLPRKKIRLLIVDDSSFFRGVLFRELSRDSSIEIIGTAIDAYDARDRLLILSLMY